MKTIQIDIAIVGGGVAGLWLLNRVKQQGFSAILIESQSLGAGQTIKSQGIIHGGMKYALQGSMTAGAEALSDIPSIWDACLAGKGEIDLSCVPILSREQYLWSNGILSQLAGIFASKTLSSHTKKLKKDEFPEIFRDPAFKGQVYALSENVIDVAALLRELAKPYENFLCHSDPIVTLDENNQIMSLKLHNELEIKAQKYIFTAGSGNELLLKKLKNSPIAMQRRPLHMVMVKHDIATPLFGHCLSVSAQPRITITTHRTRDLRYVWYIGGALAEEGVKRNTSEQIIATQKELQQLFPWCDFSHAEYASFFIDRAENKEPDGSRPVHSYFKEMGNIIVAWPTKLAFAPQLAQNILSNLQILPGGFDDKVDLSTPKIAELPWEEMFPCEVTHPSTYNNSDTS